MSEIEQVNELEHEFSKLSAETMKMNGDLHSSDLNQVTSDSIGNSLDASPSAASASSDNGSTTSSNTGIYFLRNIFQLFFEYF